MLDRLATVAPQTLQTPPVGKPTSPSPTPAAVSTAPPAPAVTGDSVTVSSPPAASPTPTPTATNAAPLAPKKWTVLIWSCSDNNLYDPMMNNLDQAERLGTNADLNIVAEASNQPKGGTVQRLLITPDKKPGLNSPVVADLGKDVDMADQESFADFLKWGETQYPAQHYLVIMADHGGGWQGACSSESHHTWMALPDIASALKEAQDSTGKKIDVLGFDACLMGSTEVVHELAPYTNYLVGSEETEAGPGWDYDPADSDLKGAPGPETRSGSIDLPQVFGLAARNEARRSHHSLVADPKGQSKFDPSPRELAEDIVKMARSHQDDLGTMSAIDTSKEPALTQAVDNFGRAILADKTATTDQWKQAINLSQKFDEFHDLSDFARIAGEKFGANDPNLKQAAKQVQDAIKDSLVAEHHSTNYPHAHGLNIELDDHPDKKLPPRLAGTLKSGETGTYADTALAKDTVWLQALHKMHGDPAQSATA